jgi:F-box protein 18 (helicase)
MPLTDKQQAVVVSNATALRVNAFAGTGKTTTLLAYAQARPNARILYVAFNKAVQREAARTFPAHVTCRTSHALAFPKFGRPYQGKLVGNLKPQIVVKALGLTERLSEERAYLLAHGALETLKNWLATPWTAIDERALDPEIPLGASKGTVLDTASQLWARMQDPADITVGMLHDGYLKRYQLSRPRLPFDLILFDEAQDANPATADMLLRQPAWKVFVGDAHQQLYAFRGAIDALAAFPAEDTRYLSGSFRFGPEVAAVANALLRTYKGEQVPLRGLRGLDTLGPPKRHSPYAIICRSNAAVFGSAVEHLSDRLYFVGGLPGYRFERLVAAHRLREGRVPRDPFLRSFPDWDAFRALAEATDDRESLSLIRTVEHYGRHIPRLVRQIERRAVPQLTAADVILTTAHKAKGLEFNQVVLTDDYVPLFANGAPVPPEAIPADEVNVLYVAATRARQRLQVNADLAQLLAQTDPNPPRAR